MLSVRIWVSGTGEKMISIERATSVEFVKYRCSPEKHAALVKEIRIRMEIIRYAQSCEGCAEETRYFPLVRMDRGV